MILNSRVPNKLIPRADFKPEQFRKVIMSHGMDLSWQQAAECPCSNPSGDYGFSLSGQSNTFSEQNRSDCPACFGKGYIWHSKQDIRAVVTGLRKEDQRFSDVGGTEYSKGQIGITLLPEHLPALGDRFTVLSSAIVYRETLIRSNTLTDKPRYPIIKRSHDLNGGVLEFGLRYLVVADANGIIDLNSQPVKDVDYQVDVNGSVEWLNAQTAPQQDQRFSIEYYANPTYLVTSHPHVVRDTQIQFKAPAPYHSELPVYAEATLEFYGTPEGA